MSINEFIAEIDKLRDRLNGDEQLCVCASGGIGGYGKPINGVSLGFDWDHGKILLHPTFPLTLIPTKDKKGPTK